MGNAEKETPIESEPIGFTSGNPEVYAMNFHAFSILSALVASAVAGAAATVDFARDIQPLLAEQCGKCHGAEKQKGGLRLDRKADALKGGESGERGIVPGHSGQSRVFQLVTSTKDDERMPPKGERLSAGQLDLLQHWIDAGAQWPDSGSDVVNPARVEMKVTDADRQHWSFVALPKIAVPSAKGVVDGFVRQAQEAKGISPSGAADARTLVRRVYFDLIGLPPTPEEMARWTARIETSRDDVAALVDELLASPHYGERWARHWLDVARYADSNGMEADNDRPNAYRYRDFVIRALNDDMRYDQFVRWQLAGDELAPKNADAIAATGFIVAGVTAALPSNLLEEEKLRERANELDDMVSTTGQAMLGLTLACARCHDHKYDPLPTRDYYRLARIFNSGDRREIPLASSAEVKVRDAELAAWKKESDATVKARNQVRKPVEELLRNERIAKLALAEEEKRKLIEKRDDKLADRFKKELKVDDAECLAALPPDGQARWRELDAVVKALDARKPEALPVTFGFADFAPEPRESWLFERGDFMSRKERMDLGFLTVLTVGRTPEDYWKAARDTKLRDDSTQQRRALAEWMTDTEHGAGALLARVMVNRVWQHHFGDGLVRTPSDFGTRGEAPTHPELLDWLAGEFIRSGWSVKHLHRLIMHSAAYQLASTFDEKKSAIDPENRLLWRRRPVRLESEPLRDSLLAVAGTLNPAVFGPSFKPPIAAEALQARNVKTPYPQDAKDTPETRRRTIYMFHKRVVQYPLMQAFDAPDAQQSCARRMNTTVAPQALALLNDPFVRQRAEELARRIQTDAGENADAQIRRAFQLCLNRDPAPDELASAREFIAAQSTARAPRDTANSQRLALTDFCQSLFGLNEFIYID